ncbi:hypothetical protein L1987_02486 [Smallanthus sonchifolius]|uniref:Uncharacterized protein n=1 Tax=Smallanthus sonchifolius TaxID=185202 RepID=A0ACB9K848_9ASTR|nr:hypothetical protein L1987_02486 [Smallanthus sonchifolius]
MGSESEFSVVQSLDDDGEIETKLKSNGVYHVEDVSEKLVKIGGSAPSDSVMSDEGVGSTSPAVSKSQGLRKWRRIPRDLVKKTGSSFNSSENGGLTVSPGPKAMVNIGDSRVQPVFDAASAPRIRNEVGNLNGGVSVLSDDQQRNGRIGPGKKARGIKIKKEDSNLTVGSDSRSSNFVFVQGSGNTVASKGRQSSAFVKYDEESSDDACYADKHLKSDAKSDVSLPADKKGKQEGSMDQDPLVESVKGLHFAQVGFEREVQKWRDVGKDDPVVFDDPLHEVLELKDAKIFKLESMLNSGDIKTELEDRLMKIIQTEVEYTVIATTTKILTEGPLHEIKRDDLERKNVSWQEKQDEKLETKEDLKKLQNRVCKFNSCFIIMLILLFVTIYLQFSPQNVEVVPT